MDFKDKIFSPYRYKNSIDMALADTIPLMNSTDYKDRLRGEYLQTRIRYQKLIAAVDACKVPLDPFVYISQLSAMRSYLQALEYRAEKEGIDLGEQA